ncbi:hypothetical protein CEP54_015956 [Fusarium duplospermum]|uniref:Uncharacterized protein n=1 Tax=Fusarium duplospermum TaxID=1325734 RepID=A0A428NJL1_9HYPO|nr:hypothetical protein CEP54_015956 [Fusarium duplospermum]
MLDQHGPLPASTREDDDALPFSRYEGPRCDNDAYDQDGYDDASGQGLASPSCADLELRIHRVEETSAILREQLASVNSKLSIIDSRLEMVPKLFSQEIARLLTGQNIWPLQGSQSQIVPLETGSDRTVDSAELIIN